MIQRNLFSNFPYTSFPPVVKADADLPGGPCRGLYIAIAGTLNLMDFDGVIHEDVMLIEGYHPLICRQVRLGGGADQIRALY